MGWIEKFRALCRKHSPSLVVQDAIRDNWDAYQEGFEKGLRISENGKITFPFDSIVVGIGDDGFPIYDSQYTAKEILDIMKGEVDIDQLVSALKDSIGDDRDKEHHG